MKGLQRELEELERADPAVRKAAQKYAEMVDKMIDRNTVTIETTTEPDGLGRQHFSVVWWDENHHQGARWRGQHFFMKVEDYLAMPGNGLTGRRVMQRHRVETKR